MSAVPTATYVHNGVALLMMRSCSVESVVFSFTEFTQSVAAESRLSAVSNNVPQGSVETGVGVAKNWLGHDESCLRLVADVQATMVFGVRPPGRCMRVVIVAPRSDPLTVGSVPLSYLIATSNGCNSVTYFSRRRFFTAAAPSRRVPTCYYS